MKNKKVIIIGIAVILVCLILIVGAAMAPRISGYFAGKKMLKELKAIDSPEYVVITDNRTENIGGELIEYDKDECLSLISSVSDALEKAEYDGVKDNFLGGWGIVVRIASSDNEELSLCFYEDSIEIESGAYTAIFSTEDSKAFDYLTWLTE